MPVPAAGGIIYAAHMLRARPKRYYDEMTGSAASGSGFTVAGISISITTETDNAELDIRWTLRVNQAGSAAATSTSARPLVTGPSSFSQNTPNYAVVSFGSNAGTGDIGMASNSYVMTLGVAGTYTVTLVATTGTNQTVFGYTSVTCVLQEQFA